MSDCKHLSAIVRGDDRIGKAYCCQCTETIQLSTVFNNFLDAMRDSIGVPTKAIEEYNVKQEKLLEEAKERERIRVKNAKTLKDLFPFLFRRNP